MTEREKALDKKVKRFDRWLIGILTNMVVSAITTLIIFELTGVL